MYTIPTGLVQSRETREFIGLKAINWGNEGNDTSIIDCTDIDIYISYYSY